MRIWLTALKLCDPPETCITASVLPWVGRTAPSDSGIQSICVFIRPVIAPWRSGEDQTIPSLHATRSRNSRTLGCVASAPSSTSGSPDGLKNRTSAPSRVRMRPASSPDSRLKLRGRSEP
jgi:hypothetical protein